MCKSKCAGGLPTCNPTGCLNAEMASPGPKAITIRRERKAEAQPASRGVELNPVALDNGEVLLSGIMPCVLEPTKYESENAFYADTVALFKELGAKAAEASKNEAADPEAFALHFQDRRELDHTIRYDVYVAEKPLVWGSEPELRLSESDKGVAEAFAQKLADSGDFGMVLIEAYRGATEILILGKVVKPKAKPLENVKPTAPRVQERLQADRYRRAALVAAANTSNMLVYRRLRTN